ncbi:MAG: hypothetical protein DME65_11520 [Verrucomicrobia bacterium]|nr:MAG: hypothetical protein DME65_11520 [Verrucomicrobiota bacterium]
MASNYSDYPELLACTGCKAAFNPILTEYEQARQWVRLYYGPYPLRRCDAIPVETQFTTILASKKR